MKQHLRALAFLAALLPSWALAQSAPANMPYHTVYGRLGAAPGDTGPGQAIPFATLSGVLLNGLCTTNNAIPIYSTASARWICLTTGTGVATALAVNVGTAGSFVVNGGALGTPSSGTLTNATGLPAATGISGLGTGVAAALGVNIGSAGAPVLFNGAGGTPTSLVGTNITGTAAGLTAGTVTTIGANQVSRANLAQGVARSVIGVTGNATANVADIQLSASQFLGTTAANTSLAGVGYGPGATAAAGQLLGEPGAGNATAGNVGETLSQNILQASAVVLSTGTPANVATITLTAGDWDIAAQVAFTGGATTNVTGLRASISTTSATENFVSPRIMASSFSGTPFATFDYTGTIAPDRVSLSGSQQFWLVSRCNFTVAACNAYGQLRARRAR